MSPDRDHDRVDGSKVYELENADGPSSSLVRPPVISARPSRSGTTIGPCLGLERLAVVSHRPDRASRISTESLPPPPGAQKLSEPTTRTSSVPSSATWVLDRASTRSPADFQAASLPAGVAVTDAAGEAGMVSVGVAEP
jgi:hypothetical protein